jgi:hypothetical protein
MKLLDSDLYNYNIKIQNMNMHNNSKTSKLYVDDNENLILNIYFFPDYNDGNIFKQEIHVMINDKEMYKINGNNLSRRTEIKYENNILKQNKLHIYYLNLYKTVFIEREENKQIVIEKNFIQTHENLSFIPRELLIYNLDFCHGYYRYYFFSNQSRRDFIKKNYEKNVLDVYDLLIPGTYRGVDLFRLLVLNILGGVFLDHKCVLMESLQNMIPKDNFYVLVKDFNRNNIYPNPFVFKKNRSELRKLIKIFCSKVNNRHLQGNDNLEFGPSFFSKYMEFECGSMPYKITHNTCDKTDKTNNKLVVDSRNGNILLYTSFEKYYQNNSILNENFHYSKMYIHKQVYFNNIKKYKNYIFYLYNHMYPDDFEYEIIHNNLHIKRIDNLEGFTYNHYLKIIDVLTNKEKLVEIGPSETYNNVICNVF